MTHCSTTTRRDVSKRTMSGRKTLKHAVVNCAVLAPWGIPSGADVSICQFRVKDGSVSFDTNMNFLTLAISSVYIPARRTDRNHHAPQARSSRVSSHVIGAKHAPACDLRARRNGEPLQHAAARQRAAARGVSGGGAGSVVPSYRSGPTSLDRRPEGAAARLHASCQRGRYPGRVGQRWQAAYPCATRKESCGKQGWGLNRKAPLVGGAR